jgi:hypothetical protein
MVEFAFGNVLVPKRRDGSFLRQHLPAFITSLITAIIVAAVTAWITVAMT